MTSAHLETDICIIGGGPAGLAAALALRQKGFDVAVADASHPPIDKACGEGIMPEGLAALRTLGVQLDEAIGVPFAGIRFLNGSQQVQAEFQSGAGIGMRRTVLHQRLVAAAERAGIRLLWGHRLTGMSDGQVELDQQRVRCRWIVGADGQQSRTRVHAQLEPQSPGTVRYGTRLHFGVRPWCEFVEVYWGDCGQMYVTPVDHEEVCVAFITSRKAMRFEQALSHFPRLQKNLKDAAVREHARGAVTASRRLQQVQRGNLALIGEAAGSVDAITGEGMAIAFRQAGALAEAICEGNLRNYEAAHRRTMRLPRLMARLMLSMDGRPEFRRRVFHAFQSQPEIFARMLAVHTGSVSPFKFGVRNGLSLGWHLLTAEAW